MATLIALSPSSHRGARDPDAQLMMRARDGDDDAFDQLVEGYYDRVRCVIQHLLGNRQQADDLTQEVFLRVYRARHNYRPESKFSTWLFVIVNNVVRNARRTLARRREVQPGGCELRRGMALDATADEFRVTRPLDATIRRELKETVRDAIDELNTRQREAIALYHFKGLSYAEVADSMNTTLCAAKALLHRARLRLRGQLQPYVNS